MATEVTETVDKEVVRFKLCRFCGNEPKIRPDSQIQRVNCRNRSCAIFGVAIPIRFWNATAPNTRQRAERAALTLKERYTMVIRDVLIDHAASCGNGIYCDCGAAAIREQIIAAVESTPVADIIAAEF